MNDACLAVTYHYVRDVRATPFPSLKALSPRHFEQQLDWLTNHFNVVGSEAVEAALLAGAPLPPRPALLTFDDGVIDHYATVLPALVKRGLSALFFVAGATLEDRPRLLNVHKTHVLLDRLGAEPLANEVRGRVRARTAGEAERWQGIYRLETDVDRATKRLLNYELPFEEADRVLEELFREEIGDSSDFARAFYLSSSLIHEMSDAGMTFGFHTHSHPVLSRLDEAAQSRELAHGVGLIRQLTDQRTASFCFPYGRPATYDGNTLRLLEDLGYTMAFNTVRRRFVVAEAERFQLPRFDTVDLPPLSDVVKAEDGTLVSVAAH